MADDYFAPKMKDFQNRGDVTIYRITIALLMTALVRLAFVYHVTLVNWD